MINRKRLVIVIAVIVVLVIVLGILRQRLLMREGLYRSVPPSITSSPDWVSEDAEDIPTSPADFSGVTIRSDIAYGTHTEERLDLYTPASTNSTVNSSSLPIIMMVHGGAWRLGDKAHSGVVKNKVDYFLPRGYAFVSINYPMRRATPLEEVNSVGKALAYLQKNASSLGLDGTRVVLMGHSAGAHLVALLTAAQDVRKEQGVQPWKGTVALDSAAYDMNALMSGEHYRFYDPVFGKSSTFWKQVSPQYAYTKPMEPLLLACSSTRPDDSCGMAEKFAATVREVGGEATVLAKPFNHGKMNYAVGSDRKFTEEIQSFLTTLGLP